MSLRRPPIAVVFRLLAGLLLLSQGGCMSALTTAAMREALRETVDSLAAAAATDHASRGGDADVSARLATDAAADESAPLISEPKPLSLDEAVDQAVARLKGVGELDAPTRATLLSILEKTSPEDWPVAIDAFAASLEAYRPPPRTPAPAPPPAQPVATTRPEPDAPLVFPASAEPDGPTFPEPATAAIVFVPPVEPHAAAAAEPRVDVALVFPAASPLPERAVAEHVVPEPAKLAVIEAARPVGPEPDAVADDESGFTPRTILERLDAKEPVALVEPQELREPRELREPPDPRQPPVASAPPAVVEPTLSVEQRVAVETPLTSEQPAPVPPPTPVLAVHNACFVSRVRAWGVVDKFPEAVFRPGQDVIVYFELEAPTTRQSPAGHTTSVDTIFRLLAADGRQVGQWDFEPVDDTSHAPRRDYFARYFVRIPETAAPGPYRLDLMVTDLVAGISSQACLDLEVRP